MVKVSIVIPAYNNPLYLLSALKSIIAQTYPDFEVVLIDDCSPNDLKCIVDLIGDNRIKYFRNKCNLGFVNNLKKGFLLAGGDYIVIMCDTDIMFPNCLEVLVRYMDENLDCSTGRSGFVRFNNVSKKICFITPQKNTVKLDNGFDSITNFLRFGVGFSTGNIFRKKMLRGEIGNGLQTCFLKPMLDSLKENRFIFIPDYLIADRMYVSAGYTIYKEKKDLYDEIMEMFNEVLIEEEFVCSKKIAIKKFIYESFVEFTNMSICVGKKRLLKRIFYIIYHFPFVLFKLNFYFYSILSIILSRKQLIFLKEKVLNYKAVQLSKKEYIINLQKIINKYENSNSN